MSHWRCRYQSKEQCLLQDIKKPTTTNHLPLNGTRKLVMSDFALPICLSPSFLYYRDSSRNQTQANAPVGTSPTRTRWGNRPLLPCCLTALERLAPSWPPAGAGPASGPGAYSWKGHWKGMKDKGLLPWPLCLLLTPASKFWHFHIGSLQHNSLILAFFLGHKVEA